MHRGGQGGFTMAEAVIVIVIIGIIGAIVGVFITGPVLNYREAVLRAEMTDIADLALRRMARDLRLALPNSIRVVSDGNASAIEFLQTKAGGRYLSLDDEVAAPPPALDFNDPTKLTFTMLGRAPTGKQVIIPGSDYVVVNNLNIDHLNAYRANETAGVQRNIARITAISADAANPVITMDSNPFAEQEPPMPSPSSRFQVVSGPVTYHCQPGVGGAGSLSRQSKYDISEAQQLLATRAPTGTSPNPQNNVIARHISACTFRYDTVANTRSALVRLTLMLTYTDPSGQINNIQLVHQIHVDNTP